MQISINCHTLTVMPGHTCFHNVVCRGVCANKREGEEVCVCTCVCVCVVDCILYNFILSVAQYPYSFMGRQIILYS